MDHSTDSTLLEIFKGVFVKSDTVFTVITTLAVFFAGVLITALIKEYSNHSKRKTHRIIVKLNISEIIKGLEYQISGFITFKDALKIDLDSPFLIKHKTIPQINSIYSIGNTDIFKSYFSGVRNSFYNEDDIRIQCVADLWSIVDHLHSYNDALKTDALNTVEKIQVFTDLRNFASQKALREIEAFLLSNSGTILTGDFKTFFLKINGLVSDFKTQPNYNMPSVMNNFFLEIQNYLISKNELCIVNKDKINIIEISESLNIALHKYANHKNYLDASSVNFVNKIETYEDYIIKLKYCNKHLCGVKNK